MSPEEFFDRPLLRQLAGEKAYQAGQDYFAAGRVRHLHNGSERVTASVAGTQVYRVKLWRKRGELRWACTCPAGRDGGFCKHCVAVGFAWLDGVEAASDREGNRQRSSAEGDLSVEQLDRHLHTLDRERLISLVLEATEYDDILRRRLLIEAIGFARSGRRGAASQTGGGPLLDLDAYRQILHESIDCSEYVDYEAMPDYAQGVEEAIRPLGDLLRMGRADAVIELAEFALIELDRVCEMLDGSDGSLNAVYDDLQHYHLEACRAARLNPEKLAARLLEYELEGGLGVFYNSARTYETVLGAKGLAAWRKMLVAEWAKLPARTAPADPAKDDAPAPIDHRRYQIQALMERQAETDGNMELLISIKQKDLSTPHDFLSLAELHETAGRHAEALSWAERGIQTFSEFNATAELRDFLMTAYQRQGRSNEALGLGWASFERFPTPEHYGALKTLAGEAAWPAWREKALTFVRNEISRHADRSALVEILLSEHADDEAWTEAVEGGCNENLWFALAHRREKQHPKDALRIYQDRLGPLITRGTQSAYKEAVYLLERIHRLLEHLGRGAEFGSYRAEVRAAHRQKRMFLKLLDASGH